MFTNEKILHYCIRDDIYGYIHSEFPFLPRQLEKENMFDQLGIQLKNPRFETSVWRRYWSLEFETYSKMLVSINQRNAFDTSVSKKLMVSKQYMIRKFKDKDLQLKMKGLFEEFYWPWNDKRQKYLNKAGKVEFHLGNTEKMVFKFTKKLMELRYDKKTINRPTAATLYVSPQDKESQEKSNQIDSWLVFGRFRGYLESIPIFN